MICKEYVWNPEDGTLNKKDKSIESVTLKASLNIIQSEIVKEYTQKSEGRFGIKSLGNELRSNDTFCAQFDEKRDFGVLVKMTENQRSFMRVFLSKLKQFGDQHIF